MASEGDATFGGQVGLVTQAYRGRPADAPSRDDRPSGLTHLRLTIGPRPDAHSRVSASQRRHPMPVLVAYASRHGATQGIAERIGAALAVAPAGPAR